MPNARDLYTTDVPLFQPTNFNYSLQRVTKNSYAANALKYIHTYMPYLSVKTKLTLKKKRRKRTQGARRKIH